MAICSVRKIEKAFHIYVSIFLLGTQRSAKNRNVDMICFRDFIYTKAEINNIPFGNSNFVLQNKYIIYERRDTYMKFKKLFCGLLTAGMLFGVSAFAEGEVISVMVDNEAVTFDQQPVIIDGRTLVPIRAVFEKAGASVEWDQDALTATIKNKKNTVTISPNNNVMYKNGNAVEIDVPAQTINDRILIPVRAISDALDFGVTWNGYQNTVLIATNNKPYRPFSASKRGFREVSAIADFYVDGSCVNSSADLNGDGINEVVSFTEALETYNSESPLLVINDVDYTAMIEKDFIGIQSFAVISADGTNKQVVITGSEGGVNCAHFYTYNGKTLVDLGDNPVISFGEKLLFDEASYIISDLHGICFTDIMITGSFYKLENGGLKYYKLAKAEEIAPRVLKKIYKDSVAFIKIQTDNFEPGTYKYLKDYDMITSSSIQYLNLLEMYVDSKSPDRVEFFVELEDGEKAVLIPYRP